MEGRINVQDSPLEMMVKLSEGNPGAARVLVELIEQSASIDPQSAFGGLGMILSMDTHKIYGGRIWMFYKDVCHESIIHMNSICRAVQLGLMRKSVMNHAIDNYGEGINLDETLKIVQERLPEFAKDMKTEPRDIT